MTALIADVVPPAERGRAVGVVDTFSSFASIVLPLVGGPLVEVAGYSSIVAFACLVTLVPFVLALRLTETRPGVYAHPVSS